MTISGQHVENQEPLVRLALDSLFDGHRDVFVDVLRFIYAQFFLVNNKSLSVSKILKLFSGLSPYSFNTSSKTWQSLRH